MAIPSLLNIPKSAQDWDRWSWTNVIQHKGIITAAKSQLGVNLNEYQIYPISFKDVEYWLEAHSQMHIEMNAAIKSQGQDLQDVDLKDEKQLIGWVYLHWQEHSTINQILKI